MKSKSFTSGFSTHFVDQLGFNLPTKVLDYRGVLNFNVAISRFN